jgi:hypothetical protein
MKSFASPQPSRPLWQVLLAPMLFLSLGLHALFLFVPVAPSDQDLVPPPDPREEEGIAISRIDPPQPRVAAAATGGQNAVTSGAGGQQSEAIKSNVAAASPAAGTSQTSASTGSSRGGSSALSPNPTSVPSSGTRRRIRQPSNGSSADTDTSEPPNLSNGSSSGAGSGAAIQGSNPRASSPNPPAPVVPTSRRVPDALREYIALLQREYTYLPTNTTAPETEEKTAAWLAEVRTASGQPNLVPQQVTSVEGVEYPLRTCLPQAPIAAQVGLRVNANNQVEGAAMLLRSTGYLALNKAAIENAKSYRFPAGSGARAYVVEVPVQYDRDRCVNLPATASR